MQFHCSMNSAVAFHCQDQSKQGCRGQGLAWLASFRALLSPFEL